MEQLPDDAAWEDLMREIWARQSDAAKRRRRQDLVQQIDAIRERLFRWYGEMPDSMPLIQEDRAR